MSDDKHPPQTRETDPSIDFVDYLPRVFQANASRFYQSILAKVFEEIASPKAVQVEETSSIDEFLDRCAALVDNHTANETAKAFALSLDGMFERQISRWISGHRQHAKYLQPALRVAERIGSFDAKAEAIADDLGEMHLVANVVRHGEGNACKKLKVQAPHLFESSEPSYYDIAAGPVPTSEALRLGHDDVKRYTRAIVRFWGLADPLESAELDPPF